MVADLEGNVAIAKPIDVDRLYGGKFRLRVRDERLQARIIKLTLV